MVVPLLARTGLAADRKVPSAVYVAVSDEQTRAASDAVATALRARGIPCEVAASAQKFGKQIRNAERRGIPYVWFPAVGDDGATSHEVKDIRSGNQVAADPASWQPPSEDLRPRIKEQNQ
ncbi:His/Gly/Thr/Pro-type tRNA ligase C-terminal domain-containing protein [Nocardioides sp. TF02-7]|nr:His/Gly/Thr/Pro-type tRNA ligase C-terminal domain-containing protein [Nocardioides sp. TF02-7]